MLSYKEYKQLNESLYGAINLGIRSPNVVSEPIGVPGGTESLESPVAEDAIEEAKKMKKKMDCDSEDSEEENKDLEVKDSEESEKEEKEEKEDSEDEDSEDEESEDKEEAEEKQPKMMKKKAKKEWAEIITDLETVLEEITDEEAINEVKKGIDMMKKGLEKGMKKKHKAEDKKEMSESEQLWWNSVNSMLNSNLNPKSWDGWEEIKDLGVSIRDEERAV